MDIFKEKKGFTSFHLTLIIVAVVIALYLFNALGSLENVVYDKMVRFRGTRPPSELVTIIAIDNETVANYGPFEQWDRDRTAQMLEKLALANPKVIGMDILFSKSEKQEELGTNAALVSAVEKNGNVVLPVFFEEKNITVKGELTSFQEASTLKGMGSVDKDLYLFPEAPGAEWCFSALSVAAAAHGHVNAIRDKDGVLRRVPLVIGHKGRYFPHMSLQLAARFTGVDIKSVSAGEDFTLSLAGNKIPIDSAGFMMVNYLANREPVPTYSWFRVMENQIPVSTFKDKIVLLGTTFVAKEMSDIYETPLGTEVPGVEFLATSVENIITLDYIRGKGLWSLLEIGLFVLAAGASALAFPRFSVKYAALLALGLIGLILAVNGYLLLHSSVWIKSVYPILTVSMCFIGTTVFGYLHAEKTVEKLSEKEREAKTMLGLSFQEKGMLDMALQTFQKLEFTTHMRQVYYSLGLDFENRGLSDKAFYVYKKVFEVDPDFEDVAERMKRLRDSGLHTAGVGHPSISPIIQTGQQIMPPPSQTNAMPQEAPTVEGTLPSADSTDMATMAFSAESQQGTPQPSGPQAPGAPAAQPAQAAPPAKWSESIGKVNRYEITKKLGRGAMGEVYQVRDPRIGRIAALKTIRPDIDLSSKEAIEMKQRFYREAQTAGKIAHPNIVTIYDVDEFQGVSYIVMEYVEGMTLREIIKKKVPLKEKQIKQIIAQAAMALDAAHQHGVFHRDIKPDNIMVTKNLHAKVMDFGIARVAESDMTKTGSILGTPAYMSPEQVNGKKIDGRSDIFSLGVCLYELLTGIAPFRGDSLTQILVGIIKHSPKPPTEINAKIPAEWDQVIGKVLAKDPEKRYQAANEFASAVMNVGAKK